MTDNDVIKFGPFRGSKMANVPDIYLRELYNELTEDIENGEMLTFDEREVYEYIEDYGVENLK